MTASRSPPSPRGARGPGPFPLVGIGGLGDQGDEAGSGHVVVFDVATAQRLAGMPDQFSYIAAAAEDGVSEDQLADDIGRVLDPTVQVSTGTAFADEQAEAAGQIVGIITM